MPSPTLDTVQDFRGLSQSTDEWVKSIVGTGSQVNTQNKSVWPFELPVGSFESVVSNFERGSELPEPALLGFTSISRHLNANIHHITDSQKSHEHFADELPYGLQALSESDSDWNDDEIAWHNGQSNENAEHTSSSQTRLGSEGRITDPETKNISEMEKRRKQNRQAQRAFRARKSKHVQDLQHEVEILKSTLDSMKHENGLLKAKLLLLADELKHSRKLLPSRRSYRTKENHSNETGGRVHSETGKAEMMSYKPADVSKMQGSGPERYRVSKS